MPPKESNDPAEIKRGKRVPAIIETMTFFNQQQETNWRRAYDWYEEWDPAKGLDSCDA